MFARTADYIHTHLLPQLPLLQGLFFALGRRAETERQRARGLFHLVERVREG